MLAIGSEIWGIYSFFYFSILPMLSSNHLYYYFLNFITAVLKLKCRSFSFMRMSSSPSVWSLEANGLLGQLPSVEYDQGKRRFVLTKNRITRLCPRISPFLEGANGLFQLLQQHSESLPMVDCPVTCLQQSPEHPPLSLSSLPRLQKNRNPESKWNRPSPLNLFLSA